MNLDHHLQNQLRTLRLGGVLETLDLRVKQAQQDSLGYLEFFQILLQDEVERREAKKLNLRLSRNPRSYPPLLCCYTGCSHP